jgi:phage-related tail protein
MRSLIASVIDQLWKLFVVQQIVGVISNALGSATGTPKSFAPTTSVKPPSFFAKGTTYAPGGMAVVGERGPELVNLPKGSEVIPNHKMGGMMGGNFNISVDARGATDPAAVRAQVQQGILEAAPAIIAAAESRTIAGLRRPRLGGAMQ